MSFNINQKILPTKILYNINPETLSTKTLKRILKQHQILSTGNKDKLVDRINTEHLSNIFKLSSINLQTIYDDLIYHRIDELKIYNVLTTTDVALLSDAMSKNTSVKNVIIYGTYVYPYVYISIDYIIKSLINNDNLRSIILRDTFYPKSINSLLRQHQHLMSIELINIINIKNENIEDLFEALYNNIAMRSLTIIGGSVYDRLTLYPATLPLMIHKNNTLQLLTLKHISIRKDILDSFSEALKTNKGIIELKMDDDVLVEISRALKYNNSITTLHLENAVIDNERLIEFSNNIKYNNKITYLDLNSLRKIGELDDDVVYRFLDSITAMHSITYLNISGNYFSTRQDHMILDYIKKNDTLISIDLDIGNHNDVVDDIIDIVKTNHTLEKIDITEFYNMGLSKEQSKAFIDVLKNNSTLTDINIRMFSEYSNMVVNNILERNRYNLQKKYRGLVNYLLASIDDNIDRTSSKNVQLIDVRQHKHNNDYHWTSEAEHEFNAFDDVYYDISERELDYYDDDISDIEYSDEDDVEDVEEDDVEYDEGDEEEEDEENDVEYNNNEEEDGDDDEEYEDEEEDEGDDVEYNNNEEDE